MRYEGFFEHLVYAPGLAWRILRFAAVLGPPTIVLVVFLFIR
jgi:hypothetical protein